MIGEIKIWYSNTIPNGWLLCDGSTFTQSDYPDLYTFLGGNTLPNLKGRIPVGKDSNDTDFNALGKTGGSKAYSHYHTTSDHTLTIEEMPNHDHSLNKSIATYSTQGTALPNEAGNTKTGYYYHAQNQGGGQAHNHGDTTRKTVSTLQPYQVVNYIIHALIITPDTKKISELNQASSINQSDVLPIVQSGETKKITTQALLNNVNTRITTNSSYSTTEQVIGTWINGKPIYRKVINFGTLPNNDAKEVSSGLSNVEIIKMYAKAYRSTDNVQFTIPFVSNTLANNVSIMYSSTNNIVITTGIDRSNTDAYVVLEYIKTTD